MRVAFKKFLLVDFSAWSWSSTAEAGFGGSGGTYQAWVGGAGTAKSPTTLIEC